MPGDALTRCVGDVDAFRRDHWARRPLLRRTGQPFDDLLDVDAIEHLLTMLGRRPGFRVVRDGETLPFDRYTVTARVGGRDVAEVADVDRIIQLVAGDHATLVVQGLQRTWLPLARFCADLQASISHPVQANAYLSPAGAKALNRHADTHAVLALHVAGSKAWNVQGLGDVVLEPGDVMYLPAGTDHEARAQDGFSLHVTIGILTIRWRDVVQRLLADGTLDDPLPLGFAEPERAEEVSAALDDALDRAGRRLASADRPAVVDAEADRARRRRRQLPGQRLRATLDPTLIGKGTRLRRTAPAAVRDGDDDDRITLDFGAVRLGLPASTRAALAAVAALDEVVVGDLPELDVDDQVVLLRRLVREGLLQPVDVPRR